MQVAVARPVGGPAASVVKCVGAPAGVTPNIDAAGHALIFTHIQKAAGTSLDRILHAAAAVQRRTHRRASGGIYGQAFGADKPEALASLALLSADELRGLDQLTGHLPFGVHARLARPALYVTMLRHPVARLVSQFRFGARRGLWPRATRIEDLFRDRRLVDNTQTRQIAGLVHRDAPCDEATLQAALGNIEWRYAIAGVAERFDETLKGLIALLGWPDIAYGDWQVAGEPADPAIEREAAEAVARYCVLDLALYERAAARPVPWSAAVLAGTPTGVARQATILLNAPDVTVNGSATAYMPAEIFDRDVAPALRAQGVDLCYA